MGLCDVSRGLSETARCVCVCSVASSLEGRGCVCVLPCVSLCVSGGVEERAQFSSCGLDFIILLFGVIITYL